MPLFELLSSAAPRVAVTALLLIAVMCFLQLSTNERVIELPYIGKFKIIQ